VTAQSVGEGLRPGRPGFYSRQASDRFPSSAHLKMILAHTTPYNWYRASFSREELTTRLLQVRR
jgi:hypothetical protein